jgi:hypothetical protein
MRVFLSGGIGSQLFQISAARLVSIELGCHLKFDPSWTRISRHPDNQSLESRLQLEERESFAKSRPLLLGAIELTVSQKFLRNMWSLSSAGVLANHSDQVTDLFFRGRLSAMSGNFTDPHPHVALKSLGKNVAVTLPDANPLKDLEEYAALHVRGGDYFELGDSFGVLDSDYYRKALETLPLGLPLVVLTNDVSHATTVIDQLGLDAPLIFGPSDLGPLESLTVLSKASAVIAANSSFSWWGAELSHRHQLKVAPSSYTPKSGSNWMIHEGWTSIEASWMRS